MLDYLCNANRHSKEYKQLSDEHMQKYGTYKSYFISWEEGMSLPKEMEHNQSKQVISLHNCKFKELALYVLVQVFLRAERDGSIAIVHVYNGARL